MATKVPILRQVAWVSIFPQFLVMGILIYGFYFFHVKEPVILGALVYLLISNSLRILIASSHRKAMRFIKNANFQQAIIHFEESVSFFEKHDLIDKYRYLTLLSSSKMSYKEMGLCNIAFCYGQINNGEKAKEYYQKVLKEYPDNILANTGLRMLNSI